MDDDDRAPAACDVDFDEDDDFDEVEEGDVERLRPTDCLVWRRPPRDGFKSRKLRSRHRQTARRSARGLGGDGGASGSCEAGSPSSESVAISPRSSDPVEGRG